MSKTRTAYGWEEDGVVFLSPFAADYENRPASRYASRDEAIAYVATRNSPGHVNIKIEWEN